MGANETDARNWFAQASVGPQFSYVLACAIADRRASHAYWSEPDPMYDDGRQRNAAMAYDAITSATEMEVLRDQLERGVITITREVSQ